MTDFMFKVASKRIFYLETTGNLVLPVSVLAVWPFAERQHAGIQPQLNSGIHQLLAFCEKCYLTLGG